MDFSSLYYSLSQSLRSEIQALEDSHQKVLMGKTKRHQELLEAARKDAVTRAQSTAEEYQTRLGEIEAERAREQAEAAGVVSELRSVSAREAEAAERAAQELQVALGLGSELKLATASADATVASLERELASEALRRRTQEEGLSSAVQAEREAQRHALTAAEANARDATEQLRLEAAAQREESERRLSHAREEREGLIRQLASVQVGRCGMWRYRWE